MAGFDPIGSWPIDALSAPLVGTYFLPAPGIIFLTGTDTQANVSGIKAAGVQRETLLATNAVIKAAGLQRETLLGAQGFIKSAGLIREVLRSGNSGPTGDNCSTCIVWG